MAKPIPVESDEPLRAEVEKAYGAPLPDASWEYLRNERFLAELQQGILEMPELVAHLRQLNQSAPAAVRRSERRVRSLGDGSIFDSINKRCAAIAEICALRARRKSSVTHFRRWALRNELLNPAGIDSWIKTVYARSIPESWPASPNPTDASNSRASFRQMPKPHRELQWIDYEASEPRIWSVPSRGLLGDLAKLSGDLADEWDWHPAHATEFLLADVTPPRPGIRSVQRSSKSGWDNRYGAYHLPHLRFTVDLQVTPEELAAWWRAERHELGIAGSRPISDESVDLALFALARDEATTWKQDWEAWNRSSTGKKFGSWRNYRTAVMRAVKGLNMPVGRF